MDIGFDGYRDDINAELDSVTKNIEPDELRDSVRHIALSDGKRLRPILTLLCYEAVNAEPGYSAEALRFAAGVELVHTSALVADDIIDRSDIRRGVKSIHEGYGKPNAVLTSNVLLGKALEIIDDREAVDAMVDSAASLGQGEAMEIAGSVESVEDSIDLAYSKTGALFVAACTLGGLAANADEDTLDYLGKYGRHLGVGFQIRDDILDYTSTREDLGKPVGKDALLERPSLVAIHSESTGSRLMDSVEHAGQRARERATKARRAAETLEPSESRKALIDITEFVVLRSS